MNLEELGITKEELLDRIVDKASTDLLNDVRIDDEGEDYWVKSPLARKLTAKVQAGVDEAISTLAEKHVLPRVNEYVERLVLQETTKWGEKRGEPMTFIEYLTARADAYLREQVNYQGKDKAQADSYSFKGTQTRITYLVNQNLQYSIEQAMKDALKIANGAIAEGIAETVKLKLQEIVNGLKVSVEA